METTGEGRPLVVQVAPRFLPSIGGVPTYVNAVVQALHGFEFTILKNQTPEELHDLPADVRVISVGPVWRDTAEAGMRRAAGMIAQSLAESLRWRKRQAVTRRLRPNLIHIHLIDQDCSWRVANRLGLRGSIRTMIRHAARLGGNPQKVLFTEHTLLSAPSTIVPKYVKDLVLDAFENIVCVERRSHETAIEYQTLHSRPRNIWYIPNSVDTKRFVRRPFPQRTPFRIGVASRINKPGYHDVLSLAHALPEHAELWVAFAGDPRRFEEFRRNVESLRVRVFANVTPFEMPAFYANIHVFFNQFPYAGMGRATLEAMSSGRPVITLAQEGEDKYPVTPANGFIVRNSPQDVIPILKELIDNRELLEMKGERARTTIEEELSDERLLPHLAAAYRKLLEGRP